MAGRCPGYSPARHSLALYERGGPAGGPPRIVLKTRKPRPPGPEMAAGTPLEGGPAQRGFDAKAAPIAPPHARSTPLAHAGDLLDRAPGARVQRHPRGCRGRP